MANIKLKENKNREIKTLNKVMVGTEKIKHISVKGYEDTKELYNGSSNSETGYAIDKISDNSRNILKEAPNKIQKIKNSGSKSFRKARRNIRDANKKIKHLQRSNKAIKIVQNMKKSSKNLRAGKRAIKTAKKTTKMAKQTVKTTAKTSQKVVQTTKAVGRLTVQMTRTAIVTIKAIAATLRAMLVAIIAGGWISVIIILIVVLIAGVFTLWNEYPTTSSENSDIVLVAKSQLGNVGGQPYWSWYGFGSRVEWCACFVSWCANECGYIDKGIIPKFANCQNGGIPWFQSNGLWIDGETIPTSGFIIFFDWENDGHSDHVGIVEKCENGKVYTVEGNSNDECKQREYDITSSVIVGYGTPIY